MAYAFLSSPVKGLEGIRTGVHDLKLPGDRAVWVDEVDHPRSHEPSLVTMDDLFRQIRDADVFIVLLGSERHGSGLTINGEPAHVSYWEAELFYAVLLKKTIHVFEIEGFKPGIKLDALLKMLRYALPSDAWSGPHPRSNITLAIYEFLAKAPSYPPRIWRSAPRLIGAFVDGLFALRGVDGSGGRAEIETLQFLDSSFADITVVPNEAVITSLLDEVRTMSTEDGRLTRLWIVYRELNGAPIENEGSADFLPYWNRFFSEWVSAGSWYGLHGHAHLSVLPALIQQAKVRKRMRALKSSEWREEHTDYAGGALASSRYSIAGLSGSRHNRQFLLHAALHDINRSMGENTADKANLLAVRGSVYRRLGSISAAVADYEEVVKLRKRSAAPDSAVGEALSELGYGYLFQLRFLRGRSLLEEGVRLLSNGSSRPGFLIRARRKLAVSYALTGHLWKAKEEFHEARTLAMQHGVFDQIRS
ncbi:MAG: hypothetical protein Q8L87_17795 [Anaerolineales bacterium]|nr:hypothetical protein [Anaerolineales bacterium]